MTYKFLLLLIGISFLIGCGEDNSKETPLTEKEIHVEEVTSVPIEALELKERIIEQKFPVIGVTEPNNSVDIVAEVTGKVTKINKELGNYVNANQTLAIIDDIIPESQYKQAQAQVLSTESNLKIAKANLMSDRMLFKNGDISELEFNSSQLALNNAEAQHLSAAAALSAAKKTFDDTRIKSPISGFISRKNIEFGTMVQVGTVVFRVVQLSKLKLKVFVPQEIINRVRVGDKAIVSVSALNGKTFDGVVKNMSPQADEATGSFLVEILTRNKENLIKAGMTAKIELLLSKKQKVLSIPEYALVNKNDENYVYKIEDDSAELVKINLGESIGENIIVKNGLKVGDKIVVVGMKNLGVKTKVNVEVMH